MAWAEKYGLDSLFRLRRVPLVFVTEHRPGSPRTPGAGALGTVSTAPLSPSDTCRRWNRHLLLNSAVLRANPCQTHAA